MTRIGVPATAVRRQIVCSCVSRDAIQTGMFDDAIINKTVADGAAAPRGPASEDKLDIWFRTYRAPLVRWLALKISDPETAQDIAQSAFLYLFHLAARTNINHPQALLFKTAGWLAANEIRRRRRWAQNCAHLDDLPDSECIASVNAEAETPESMTNARQEALLTLHAIDRLPAKARTAFRLSRIEGLTYDEIAAKMSISKSAVEKHMILARKRLREAMPPLN